MVMNDFQDVDDDGKQVRLFKEAAEKVNNFFSSNENAKVVVNCFAGLSRSSSSVLAYLVMYKNMSAMAALETVKLKRDILPNNSNLAHLARIHNEKYGHVVDQVFDVEKNDRDLQREKFIVFLREHY